MTKDTKKSKADSSQIAVNRKVRHDFTLEKQFQAGIVLEGWEVKSLRAGRVQLRDAYVVIKQGEAWLLGALITPLPTAASHVKTDPTRTRKLLLHQNELKTLIGAVEQKGYTIVPLSLFWQRGRAKCEIALAKGKKTFDKRETEKRRDWQREKERLFKTGR